MADDNRTLTIKAFGFTTGPTRANCDSRRRDWLDLGLTPAALGPGLAAYITGGSRH